MKNMMSRTVWIAMAALMLSAGAGWAQSLGDVARQVRKNKPPTDTSRHYDNDNIPNEGQVSVVGPEPAAAAADEKKEASASTSADPKAAEADRKQNAENLQKQIDGEKDKIAAIAHELELDQREYRLRAAEFYSDAGNRLRNSADWDKQDAQFKTTIEAKQKELDAAQQQLTDLVEQGRKAGVKEKDSDSADTKKDSDKQGGDGGDKGKP
jgi:hypothetical protein